MRLNYLTGQLQHPPALSLRPAGLDFLTPAISATWQDYRYETGLLAEWDFSAGTGATVEDLVGSSDINLAAPASQTYAWASHGITTTAGLVQTPSITGVRTVMMVCRTALDAKTYFLLSGGDGSGFGMYPDSFSTGYSYHVGFGHGVAPLWHSAGTNAHRVYSGGWMVFFCDFATAKNTILGMGGRHSTTTNRYPTFEIAYAACFSGALNDANRAQLYTLARVLLKSRGHYLDWRDCPTKINLVAVAGQSNAEGRAKKADVDAGTLATSLSRATINHWNARTPTGLTLTNQTLTNPSTDFGPTLALTWKHANGSKAENISFALTAFGSSYLANTGNTWSVAASPSSSYTNNFLRTLWANQAYWLNQGIGPRLNIFWMQGEQDATSSTYGAAYQANLEAWVTKVREQIGGGTDVPIIIGRIRDLDPSTTAGRVAVRAAQVTVGGQTGNDWLDTDTCALAADNVHYNAPGQLALADLLLPYLV